MKDINKQYKLLFEKLKNTTDNENNQYENVYTFMNIINELIKYENMNIDIVGSWIWIDGNVYEIKDKSKETGSKLSGNKRKVTTRIVYQAKIRQIDYHIIKL